MITHEKISVLKDNFLEYETGTTQNLEKRRRELKSYQVGWRNIRTARAMPLSGLAPEFRPNRKGQDCI